MRVRLFEVGSGTLGMVLRFDQFPVHVALGGDGDLSCSETFLTPPVFSINEEEGQVIFDATESTHPPMVNQAPMIRGPLMPGDRLAVCDREFVVSYERTATHDPPPPQFKMPAMS